MFGPTAQIPMANRGQTPYISSQLCSLTAILGFAGLVLDYGQAAAKHRQVQNAADAAAQAAAYQIYAGNSEATATTSADLVMQQYGYTASNVTQLSYLDSSRRRHGHSFQCDLCASLSERNI